MSAVERPGGVSKQSSPVIDRLTGLGFDKLGKDPKPDAVDTILRKWSSSLDGADPLRVRSERQGILLLSEIAAADIDAAIQTRPSAGVGGEVSGRALALSDPEPWPESVDGADVLDELAATFRRFLVLPEGAADACALWVLHAHAHDAAEVSPLLAVTSPEHRCGKTTTLKLLSAFAPRPLKASSLTPSVLFRAVEKYRPTLLVDEADSFITRNDELRGMLDSGHERAFAFVLRSVGDEHDTRLFSTWAPKAIAIIGRLAGTLSDRSIEIRMRRKAKGERVKPLRLDRLKGLEPLRRKAWAWSQANLESLRNGDPEVLKELHDRAADNWRPLLSIADQAGGRWPKKAREAAKLLSGALDEEDDSARVMLLADLREVFDEKGAGQLSTAALLAFLNSKEDRPWAEWRRGNPLSAVGLAKLLKPFDVRPKPLWTDTKDDDKDQKKTLRGYLCEDLEDAFLRYLPASNPQDPQESRNHAAKPEPSTRKDDPALTGAQSVENPHEQDTLTGLAGGNRGAGDRRVLAVHEVAG